MPDESPEDEAAMVAEASGPPPEVMPEERRDVEEAALRLLSSQLGARALDPR